jgi:hypothetical protein
VDCRHHLDCALVDEGNVVNPACQHSYIYNLAVVPLLYSHIIKQNIRKGHSRTFLYRPISPHPPLAKLVKQTSRSEEIIENNLEAESRGVGFNYCFNYSKNYSLGVGKYAITRGRVLLYL